MWQATVNVVQQELPLLVFARSLFLLSKMHAAGRLSTTHLFPDSGLLPEARRKSGRIPARVPDSDPGSETMSQFVIPANSHEREREPDQEILEKTAFSWIPDLPSLRFVRPE